MLFACLICLMQEPLRLVPLTLELPCVKFCLQNILVSKSIISQSNSHNSLTFHCQCLAIFILSLSSASCRSDGMQSGPRRKPVQ